MQGVLAYLHAGQMHLCAARYLAEFLAYMTCMLRLKRTCHHAVALHSHSQLTDIMARTCVVHVH